MPETSFASLGPTLLARKGGAKPAMRPQLGALGGMGAGFAPANEPLVESELDDLGWNDMGEEPTVQPEAEVIPLTSASGPAEAPQEPQVRSERAHAEKRLAAAAAETAPAKGKRAAFTLRLDAERHLRLRLASTVQGRSAQAIVTEALDALLGQIPEIEELAAKVSRT